MRRVKETFCARRRNTNIYLGQRHSLRVERATRYVLMFRRTIKSGAETDKKAFCFNLGCRLNKTIVMCFKTTESVSKHS